MLEFLSDFSLRLVIALVAVVLALPFVLARRRAAAADRERLGLAGRRALGRVLEVWQDGDGWNITYEFTPNGQTTSVRKTESFEGFKRAPATIGESIQVAYEDSPPFYSVPVMPASTEHQDVADTQVGGRRK